MKGSTKFWIGILISIILYGIYLFINNWNTTLKDDHEGIIIISIVLLCLWELATGTIRDSEEYDYEKHGFEWYAISIFFGIYVIIRDYLNPFFRQNIKRLI